MVKFSGNLARLVLGVGLVAALPTKRAANLKAFDISEPQSSSFWSCVVSDGYGKAVIRGYQQACGVGGEVDPNFLTSYKAAKAAGVSKVDGYMFPCTGTQSGTVCKSPQTQLDEFLDYIGDNSMDLEYLWFDVEPTSGACNAWNLSPSSNLALAQEWVSILKASELKWGIYGNGNQWTSMFPSRSSNIGSDLPLWAVQDDDEPGVSTVDTFMGGWTTAFAKQYDLDTTLCGGSVDLDSFLS